MKNSVLILDDDISLTKALSIEFKDHGYDPVIIHSIEDIPNIKFEFAIVDIRLNGEFGLDALDIILKTSPQCKVVVLTGYGSIATAVEAVKLGAVEYLTKPVSFELLKSALDGTLKKPDPNFKPQSLSQVEHEHIDFVLTKNKGNISKTAKDLGLHRQSLQRKLKKYT